MTDRELLELAAKACKLEEAKLRIEFNQWNPLTDDGDALRLAVKLKIDVFFHAHRVEGHVAGGRIPPVRAIEREDYENDPLAATRRAITRAAAEIGRNMT
jgi:hypothetical protein